jgi:hypothetical protein
MGKTTLLIHGLTTKCKPKMHFLILAMKMGMRVMIWDYDKPTNVSSRGN